MTTDTEAQPSSAKPGTDQTPAAAGLIAAFARRGIITAVQADENGNTSVAYRSGSIRAEFYLCLPDRRFSATHPTWMHDSSWYGWIDDAGDYSEMSLPEDLTLPEQNARAAEAFAEWLTAQEDADVPDGGAA